MEYCVKLPKTKDRQHYYTLRDDYLEGLFKKNRERERIYSFDKKLINQRGQDVANGLWKYHIS